MSAKSMRCSQTFHKDELNYGEGGWGGCIDCNYKEKKEEI